jgi:hypothetical protein
MASSSVAAPVWQVCLGVDAVGCLLDMARTTVALADKIKGIFGRKMELDCNGCGRHKHRRQEVCGIGRRLEGSVGVYDIERQGGVCLCIDLVNDEAFRLVADPKN